jgi:hypothetical protein
VTRLRRTGLAIGSLVVPLAIGLSGCEESGLPAVGPAATLTLQTFDGRSCPLAGAEDVTFRIEPGEADPVQVVAADGMTFHVQWPPGFVAGTTDDPVVRDPTGHVVARDGQRLVVPAKGFPRLPGGWPVCFGGGSIWVQDHPID